VQGGAGHANGDKLTSIENVTGSSFSDLLSGDAGVNVLDGADGHDTLIGGNGSDTMTGGGGSDVFVWLDTIVGKDTITDFDSGLDVLDISDLVTGFDPLTSDAGSFVRFPQSGGNTIVQVDADGTVGGSDFVTLVTLKGVSGVTVEGLVINGSIDLTA
jgi:Ca2+-binding RTX toxin-like protein